jgi:hypothetical protein
MSNKALDLGFKKQKGFDSHAPSAAAAEDDKAN